MASRAQFYLKSVESARPQRTVAVAVSLEAVLVRAHGEVVHGALVEGVGGVHHLVRRPRRVLLRLSPAGEDRHVLGHLGVVLRHDDRVAQHLAVRVAEVVLAVPVQNVVLRNAKYGWN